jgi:hypothetical protein
MRTCIPWNPVIKKNMLPNTVSDMLVSNVLYSINWINKNNQAQIEVNHAYQYALS